MSQGPDVTSRPHASADHKDGDTGVVDETVRDAPERDVAGAIVPVRPDDDEIGGFRFRGVEDPGCGVAAPRQIAGVDTLCPRASNERDQYLSSLGDRVAVAFVA